MCNMKLYKRLDFALSASSSLFFFSFFNFLFDFATLKIVYFVLFYFVFFSFTKLLPQRQGPAVGQTLGELSAAAWRLWQGLSRNQRASCWTGDSRLTAVHPLLALQFRWSWLSGCGKPRGDVHARSHGHTHTRAHTHTHIWRQIKKATVHLGRPPLEDVWEGFLVAVSPLHCLLGWPVVFQPGTDQDLQCTG